MPPLSIPVKTNSPLAPHTYIKIGGPAQFLTLARSTKALVEAISQARQAGLPYRVLGGGSNVLVADSGLPGLTIINQARSITLDAHDPTLVHVTAGTLVNHLVNFSLSHGLSGLEPFLGIPGTVGGAIFNNSHYLTELFGSKVIAVDALSQAGDHITLSQADCHFAYDSSVFQTNGAIILKAHLRLAHGDPDVLRATATAALKRRQRTQPLEYPSSGCMFKNPSPQECQQQGLSPCAAGYLIDQAGLKGVTIGTAQVSTKHANFIVNLGQATAAQVVALSNQVKNAVFQRFKITLEREIFLLGDHPAVA